MIFLHLKSQYELRFFYFRKKIECCDVYYERRTHHEKLKMSSEESIQIHFPLEDKSCIVINTLDSRNQKKIEKKFEELFGETDWDD